MKAAELETDTGLVFEKTTAATIKRTTPKSKEKGEIRNPTQIKEDDVPVRIRIVRNETLEARSNRSNTRILNWRIYLF
jgi:hypothetical protein